MKDICVVNISFRCLFQKNLSSRGFSVLETLISMLLFAIAVAGGISVYFNADRIETLAMHKKIAIEMASSSMEELRRLGYTAFSASHGVTNPTATPLVFPSPPEVLTVGDIEARRVFRYETPSTGVAPADYREVTVAVSWTEANQTDLKRAEMVSYVAP